MNAKERMEALGDKASKAIEAQGMTARFIYIEVEQILYVFCDGFAFSHCYGDSEKGFLNIIIEKIKA